MRITIIAATGGIGRHLLDQCLTRGHEVTAVVRTPSKLTRDAHAVVRIDLAQPDPAALARAVDGADAVLSAFGPSSRADHGITAKGTRAVIEAMQRVGTRRVVVVSSALVLTTPSPGRPHPPGHDPAEGLVMRVLGAPIARHVLGRHFADLAAMEDDLRDANLDWTAVRPPRLTNQPPTGGYRTVVEHNPHHFRPVGRADVADCMLRALGDPSTIKQAVGVSR